MKKIDKIAQELRRIADENNGVIMPETVVEEARQVTSPLHSRFEWDDGKAADRYRIWQARCLIKVCVEQLPGVSAPTEVFVSLVSDRKHDGGYRVMTEVLSSEELRQQMLQDALSDLELFQTRYHRLRELDGVFREIHKIRRGRRGGEKRVRELQSVA